MPRQTLQLQFPRLGVVRRHGLTATGNQDEWPSPWSVNTRLEDSLTNRLRGGSFVAQTSSVIDERFVILGEDGDGILLEDEDEIAGEMDDRLFVYLTTGNGHEITTENGDSIVLGPRNSVATGDGRDWVAGGSDAPFAGTADCLYRGRLCRVDDNAILTSRQGDYTEWDYGAELEDAGRAMAFQLSEASEIGEDVVALVPDKDGHLICFTAAETWVLNGDPTTGSLRNVSREVGCIGSRAWCKANGTVYFLSSLGLYSVQADGSGMKAVSEDKIPEDLTGIDDDDAVLDYWHGERGVSIHLTGDVVSWFYDVERQGFWPFDLDTTDSHVLFGPFRLGQPRSYGRVLNLHGNIASGSADVAWHLVTGDTAEDAAANGKAAITAALAGTSYSSYVSSSGTFEAGRAHMAYPRTRAIWCCLWLSSEGVWAHETASMTATVSGDWR